MMDTLPWTTVTDPNSSERRAYVFDRNRGVMATCYRNNKQESMEIAALITEAVNAHFGKVNIPVVTELVPDFQTALALSEVLNDVSQRRVLSRFMEIATTHQHEDKRNAFVAAVRGELFGGRVDG